jgi:glycosyltransferase involved in cell wall biosynthesis
VRALPDLFKSCRHYRLLIAGPVKAGCGDYWSGVQQELVKIQAASRVALRIEFIPDDQTEVYFKAADLLVLPYVTIFQSGVLFLGFSFGLPAVVSEVGSLQSEVSSNRTGYSFKPKSPSSLAEAVERYFESPLARLSDEERRRNIIEHTNRSHSWETVAAMTRDVYLRAKAREMHSLGEASSHQ